MPTPGSPPFTGTSQFASDSGMPPFALANEFELYDADDVHHTAGGSLFDFAGGELIDPTVFAESKPFSSGPIPSTRTNLNRAAPDCHQLPSHRGSSSSSSSRESANSNSAKTSNTSADVMMTDEHVPAWHFENVMRHETSFMFDSTDAATMDMSNVFDFESASSSPSPPTNGPIQESNAAGQLMSNGPVAKRIKGHHKGQSVCTPLLIHHIVTMFELISV